ncbi:hypothetical protein RND71_038328 [Anisodus tanguticus]|uniref:Origin recognition complex subunit 2 n=1 Tax=Anisodus tanguticus TaxID=243964 RepID=A0AAE1R2F9_9SOLA|nr:hypothetical protein RND71_038328 [Anisodus tanguticus]
MATSVCILVHNIDGPGLCDSDSQQCLVSIASCSHVRMVASIDHYHKKAKPLLKDLDVYKRSKALRLSANSNKFYKHYTSINDLKPVEEDCTQAMILLGSDKPLQVSYPGDNENPIDVDATFDFSNLASRQSKSTFPMQRSKRVFENQFGDNQSAKRSREESTFPVDTTTSSGTDTDFSMPSSSRTPSTSTPQAETEKEKEEEEMSDDIPLRNFIPKGVHRTYWNFDKNVASTSKATDEEMDLDYVAPTSEATPATTSSEQENTESEIDSEVIPYSFMFQMKSCSSNWN